MLPLCTCISQSCNKREPLENKVAMVNLAGILRDHWVNVLIPVGFVIGWYLDRRNDEKLSTFRNKSMLYKRELKPGEEVTWR
uniref:NADH dehydrogenase [ubiquinone] 1 beta subcomplex subunit 1 n=2 Tax=Xenopus tropicalis TaxID=8364 RepID=A0A803J5X2_XENTR